MFQTRSEENGIREYLRLDEALEAANRDQTIWKISFPVSSNERVRLIRWAANEWHYQPILESK